MLWVLDCLEDIRSDLSVFHRVDDMDGMPAHRFWSFVMRLPHYGGALAALALAEVAQQPQAPRSAHPAPEPELELWQMSPALPDGANVVDSNYAILGNQRGMSQIASHSYAPAV